MSTSSSFIIGTRASALALRQAEIVAELLRKANPDAEFRLKPMTTRADRLTDRPVSDLGDKGVFVRPIQEELRSGVIDIAVHSLKDVPADVEVPGLILTAFPERADPRDVFISHSFQRFDGLPASFRLGTSSPRRQWLVRTMHPDCRIVPIRGNVETRLRKLDQGDYDGLVLAAAGLIRLGLAYRIQQYLDVETFVPDAGQGTLVVETRDNGHALDVVVRIDDPVIRAVALAERALVRRLGAGCESPVGAHAIIDDGVLHLRAIAPARGGDQSVVLSAHGNPGEAEKLGDALGVQLLLATQ